MKHIITLVAILFAVVVGFTGCSKKEGVDTAQLESSFATSDASTKSKIDKAVVSIKNADYASAVTQLQATIASGKITPEQEQAIKNVMEQLQKLAVENLNKAAEGANKAMGDLQKSLSK